MNKHVFTSKNHLLRISLLALAISSTALADQPAGADKNTSQNKKATKVDAVIAMPVDAIPVGGVPAPVTLGGVYDDSFKSTDLNHDGKISFEELEEFKQLKSQARAKKEANRLLKGCDKNKDGMISLSELPSEEEMTLGMDEIAFLDNAKSMENIMSLRCMFPKEILEIMDFNEDGVITMEEMMQGVSSDRPPNKKVEKKMQKKMQSREAKRRKKEFAKCDANADEILTLREAFSMKCSLHLYTEQFDAYDINSDSVLTIDELAKEIKPLRFEAPVDPEFLKRRKKMPPLSRLQTAMYECDKDEDGRLSKSETVGARCEQDLAYFDRVDHNLDGYVTNKEIDRMRSKQSFDRMDKNKNGFLEPKEYKGKRRYRYE